VRTTTPFTLKGIDHLLLLVNGMDRAISFYEDVLGCTVEAKLPQYGMAELRAGASHLDLVDTAAAEGSWSLPTVAGGRNVDHICLALGPHDEAALRSHLAAHQVQIVEERTNEDASGTSLSLYVRDPSGNTIELMAPPNLE
jgi:catechol 2,3-dioxygenase-like lactoylglutathione lyase family enzyme